MTSYVYRVVLEQDGDGWRAFVPVLEAKGASAWGKTQDEALRNIEEVAQMVVESLLEDGEAIPDGVTIANEPLVAWYPHSNGMTFDSIDNEAATDSTSTSAVAA